MDSFAASAYQLSGISLSQHQLRQFDIFEQELMEWNQRFNLTAIRDVEGIRAKHFLDSLTAVRELQNPNPGKLIDVGSGAGFPGIPLKIAFPGMKLTLVESVGKKAGFCQHIVEKLALENVEVLNARAEDLGTDSHYREKFDWAIARAVAVLPVLAEYLLPLVRIGGGMLAQKGESAHVEVQSSEKALRILGGSLRRISQVTLPGVADERYLVVIDKKSASPAQYPRRTGLAQKKPL